MGSQSPLLNRSNTTASGRCSVPSKRSTDETMVIAPSPISLILFSLLLLLLTTTSTVTLARTPARFNISHYIYPKTSDEFRPQPSLFLTEVLQTIAKGEKWRADDVRVSKLEVGKVKYGVLQGYDIRVRFGGKIDLVFKSWDEVSEWKKFKEGDDFESLANQVSSNLVLDSLKLVGPFVLSVASHDDYLSLMLPLNSSHTSLKQILVGEGITVEVKGAQSLLYASALDLRANSSSKIKNQQSESWSFMRSLCMAVTPIKIFGSASVIAFRTRNPKAHIEAVLMSKETIELLPEKCYSRHTYKSRKCPLPSLRLRVSLLEKLLRRIFDDRVNQNPISGYFKIKFHASSVFRFQLELERDVRSNDTQWSTMAEWRTRPTVERAWFQVLARTEMKRLKPLMVKKVKPFIGVDSWAWSKLMSNISFTKFPSDLVAPEPLTLDVRW